MPQLGRQPARLDPRPIRDLAGLLAAHLGLLAPLTMWQRHNETLLFSRLEVAARLGRCRKDYVRREADFC